MTPAQARRLLLKQCADQHKEFFANCSDSLVLSMAQGADLQVRITWEDKGTDNREDRHV